MIFEGIFSDMWIDNTLYDLRRSGSVAMPGYMKPEGVVIYHTASHTYFKKNA